VDASVGVRNSQNAAPFVRRIEGTDQFTYTARVDVVEAPQVQQDPPLAAEKKSVDALAEPGVERHAKCALNCEDQLIGALFECGGHGPSSH
jgi:hypothetical protein